MESSNVPNETPEDGQQGERAPVENSDLDPYFLERMAGRTTVLLVLVNGVLHFAGGEPLSDPISVTTFWLAVSAAGSAAVGFCWEHLR